MPPPGGAAPDLPRRARCHCAPGDLPGGGEAGKGRRRHWRTLPDVGPVVAEAMAVNAVLRAFSGYILFLLAFLLRSVDLGTVFHHPVSHNFALGALALGLSAGSLASMVLGSFFRSRAPQLIMFTVLAIAPVVTAVCAWGFGLWAAVVVEFTAIFCASLAKLAQDSIVGREIGDEIRSSTFSVSETLNQVANVAGGLAGVRRVHPRQRPGGPGDRRRAASSSRSSCWSCGAGSGSGLGAELTLPAARRSPPPTA